MANPVVSTDISKNLDVQMMGLSCKSNKSDTNKSYLHLGDNAFDITF